MSEREKQPDHPIIGGIHKVIEGYLCQCAIQAKLHNKSGTKQVTSPACE